MSANMKKIGTLLIVLAFFASALVVSTPVGADGSRVVEVFIGGHTAPSDTTPLPDANVTFDVTIQAEDENVTNVNVAFVAVATKGGTDIPLMNVDLGQDLNNTTPVTVPGYWDPSNGGPAPDASEAYNITATVTGTADVNGSNNSQVLGMVDWKAADMGVTAVSAPSTGLIGDDLTVVVELTNGGDAPFDGNVSVDLLAGTSNVGSGFHDATTTAVPVAGTADVQFTVDTSGFSAGDVKFTAFTSNPAGTDDPDANATTTFAAKVTDVSVTDITFDPAAGNKHTGTVTITADVANDGTMDAVDYTLTFSAGTNTIGTADVNVTMGGTNSSSIDWTTPSSATEKTYTINVSGADGFMTKNITIGPEPAEVLGVTGIAVNPTALTAQEDVGDMEELTVTVTVSNTGDKDATGATVSLTANGADAGSQMVDVAQGAQVEVVFYYNATTAENDANLTLNATIAGASNEKTLVVPGDVDMAEFEISAITPSVMTQERGLDITVTATVKNTGDKMADTVEVTFMAGSTEIGKATLYNVSDENTTDPITWSIPKTFDLGVLALNASIGDVAISSNFTVIEYKTPSLTTEFALNKKGKVASYSGEAADGSKDTLKVKVTLDNSEGTADAKDVKVVIKDSKGKEVGSANVGTVAAGQSSESTIAIKLKAGASGKFSATASYNDTHGNVMPAATSTASAKYDVKVVPGFEAIIFAAAIGVALVVLTRRRK